MDLSALLTRLNLRIGDTDNFTFTSDEKTQALTEAINDDYVVREGWDTTLSYTEGTYQYAIPSGVTVVLDIGIKPDNSQDNPVSIGGGWSVVGSNIQFSGPSQIPTGYTMYLRSRYKYTVSDTITEVNLQEYILTLAQLRLYKIMLNKKSMRFLKNDTTVGEIVAIKRDLEQDVLRYRQRLPKVFMVA